jgi:UDP-N-acetylglucosamine transferase subunit ALG13
MGTTFDVLSESDLRGTLVLILVLLGTNPYSFSRLAKAADEYAGAYNQEMFIQLGNTRDYAPKKARYQRFLGKQDLLKKIEEADLVVTQGGFGSIADCLLAGKTVVAVPRKPELKEAPDKQEELVRELEKLGRLIGVYEIENLPEAIKKAKLMDFQPSKKQKIGSIIKAFIQDNI